ncbi:MAG: DUF1080 domain-containing protein [Planctomycetota bacterium]|nr:DUF1080 domain-containing protein [Planctomycetota bacterium]
MAKRARFLSFVVFCLVAVLVVSWSVYPWAEAQEGPNWHKGLPKQYKSKWLVHDLKRPKPEVVTQAGPVGSAPSDAIVLFDGKDLSQWAKGNGKPAAWTVKDGYAELNHTGNIRTKKEFGDCQFHIEWRAPAEPRGVSQARGNSGIFFMGLYEVQIMDSHKNATYADGSAASIYGQHPPLVNACRKPGEWQVYDIVFRRPRFKDGKMSEPGRFTVLHNGVLVQHNTESFGETAWRRLAKYRKALEKGPISIQDHGDRQKVAYRNIWIRELDLSGSD